MTMSLIPHDTRAWETMTVRLTVASAILSCIGLLFSFFGEKREYFKRLDRIVSFSGAVIAMLLTCPRILIHS